MASITLQVDASTNLTATYNFYRKNPSDLTFSKTPVNASPVPVVNGTVTFVDNTVLVGHIYDYVSTDIQNGVESGFSNEVISVAVPFPLSPAGINLGAAASFLVLGGAAVTNTGPTTVNGDVGVSPGSSITGFPPGALSGTLHSGGPTDFVSAAAQAAAATAFAAIIAAANPPGIGGAKAQGPFTLTSCTVAAASGSTNYLGTFPVGSSLVGQMVTVSGFTNSVNNGTFLCTSQSITSIALNNPNAVAETASGSAVVPATSGSSFTLLSADIGGQTLSPGVYSTAPAGALGITGRLVLDAGGNPQAVFIFKVGTALTMAGDVILANGAQASNIFWAIGSSATIGTGSSLAGTLIAKQSVTLVTDATVNGRVIAQVGAVTMDTNTISLFLSASLNVWAPNTFFPLGTVIYDCATGTFQWVTTAGVSGSAKPSFNTGTGQTTQDGSVIWTDPPIGEFLVQGPLPPTPLNQPPAPPAPPTNLRITSEVG